ncbi:MAG: hypothetical protein QM692_13585, partial [Thermomicrobiales bacterium]
MHALQAGLPASWQGVWHDAAAATISSNHARVQVSSVACVQLDGVGQEYPLHGGASSRGAGAPGPG